MALKKLDVFVHIKRIKLEDEEEEAISVSTGTALLKDANGFLLRAADGKYLAVKA